MTQAYTFARAGVSGLCLAASLIFMGYQAPVASAQVLYGSIVGTVTAPSNAVVVKATVTATSASTGLSRQAIADAAGYYSIPNLPEGNYDLAVSASGFKPLTQKSVNVLINNALDGRQACYLAYSRPFNTLYLVDDAGAVLVGGMTMNGSGSIFNSQCTISGAGSSATGSGNTLTLTLNVSFATAFAGQRLVYTAARTQAEANSGWHALGAWNIPGGPSTSPSVTSLTPARGAGLSQVFSFTFTDNLGWQNLNVVNILINSALDGNQSCYLAYSGPAGQLYLVPDAGTGLLPGLTLNGSGSVSNHQCTVNGVASSVAGSGNTLTLNLSISFSSSFLRDSIVYLAARDMQGNNTGWQTMGTWSSR